MRTSVEGLSTALEGLKEIIDVKIAGLGARMDEGFKSSAEHTEKIIGDVMSTHLKEHHGNGLSRQNEIDARIKEEIARCPAIQEYNERKATWKAVLQQWGPVFFAAVASILAVIAANYANAGGR